MPAEAIATLPQAPTWAIRAAVLSVFDLDWLTPVEALDEAGQAELVSFLDASCEQVIDESGAPWWQLRDEERGRILREAPRQELRAALDSVSARPDDPVQTALTRYVAGVPGPQEELDAAALRAELRLGRWIGRPAGPGEGAEEIRSRLGWLTLTEPLRRLSAHGFYGRQGVLGELRTFIQRESYAGDQGARDTGFLIEGVGGAGKSSLLAQLIPDVPRPDYVVAYLSFDRGWLIDNGDMGLFDEILRQVGAQLPVSQQGWVTDLRRDAKVLAARAGQYLDDASREAQAGNAVSRRLISRLGNRLRGDARLVVVLDTLEELTRREDAVGFTVFRFLEQLATAVPAARVVGAGRTIPQIARETSTVRRLAGLDPDEALDLLRALTSGTAVDDGTLREIIGLVGGNPLSLHLAADVLNRTGDNPARVIAVTEGNVQGQLYLRLLDHIRDPRVRAVAHPGLVVRRITPDIIRNVLAGPCGIAPVTDAEAEDIFRAFRREATLCEDSPDGDGALMHRPDVRAIMLPAIRRDRPTTTRAIHEAAVTYYTARASHGTEAGNRDGQPAPADAVAARELIYHLLMLDDATAGPRDDYLDAIWDPATGAEIAAVIDELPPRGQLYVASKVQGLRLAPAARAAADDDQWRAVVRPGALQLMGADRPDEALYLVRERRDPDGHALLPDIEVEALERLGRVQEALDLAAAERARAASHGDADLVRTLITAQARLHERLGERPEAWRLWQTLAELDQARRDRTGALDDEVRIRELVVLTSLLRLARHLPRQADEAAALREETVRLCEQTPERVLASAPSLLRDLAGEVGTASAEILALAVRVLGVPEEALRQGQDEERPGPAAPSADDSAAEARTAGDSRVVAARDQIVEGYQQATESSQKHRVEVSGSQGVQVGDHNVRVNYFGYPGAEPVRGPVVVGDVPLQSSAFQLREEQMARLRVAGPRASVVRAVTGMRGVGKTQLAAAYARECIEAGWRLVAWINAEDTTAILSGLAVVAAGLGLAYPGSDLEASAAQVRHRLEADGDRCLVVFDDVGDVGALRRYIPAAGLCRVIITSRDTGGAALGVPVPVDVFTPEQSLAFLAERTGLQPESAAHELAAELGGLPLALAQAASVIASQRLSYATYLSRLRSLPLSGFLRRAVGDPYPQGVAEAILLSLDAVARADEAGRSMALLDLLALLSPSGASRSLLYAVDPDLPDYTVDDALGRLAEASLLTFTVDGAAVTAHRLVTRVVRERQTGDGTLPANGARACALLEGARATLGEVWQNRGAAREWVQHVTALTDNFSVGAQDRDITKSLLGLRAWALRYLLDLGESPYQAVELGEPLLVGWQRVQGDDHPVTLSSMHNLALAYQQAGRLDNAVSLFETTLMDRMRVLGEHPDTIRTRANLAGAYRAVQRLTEAVSLYEAALVESERMLGPSHPETLALRTALAGAYVSADRVDEAIPLLQATQSELERVVGPSHPETLASRANLARAYQAAGRLEDAIPLFEATLTDRQRVLGDSHPETLSSQSDLAAAYLSAGRREQAVPLLEDALLWLVRVLGDDHPYTETARQRLAAVDVTPKSGTGGAEMVYDIGLNPVKEILVRYIYQAADISMISSQSGLEQGSIAAGGAAVNYWQVVLERACLEGLPKVDRVLDRAIQHLKGTVAEESLRTAVERYREARG